MKKKIVLALLIMCLFLVVGCNKNKKLSEVSSMKVIINDKEYVMNLEDNNTVDDFIDLLPLNLNMSDLNDNEKYAYLDVNLKTNSYSPKEIKKGDVMLFGNNCIVIFYKSFSTSYSYTKIGHIDNLEDLDNKDIIVRFEK